MAVLICYRALPELHALVDAEVAVSPIVFRALVKRDALSSKEADTAFEAIAVGRDRLDAPIHRYARRLFDEARAATARIMRSRLFVTR